MSLSEERINEIRQQLEGVPEDKQQEKLQEILSNIPPEELEELKTQQCVFCAIAKGALSAYKIYEDESLIAVLDINPATRGHTILFSKSHYQIISLLPQEAQIRLFTVATKLSKVIYEATQAKGTNLLVQSGQSAGQVVPHAGVHIIPRFEDDDVALAWNTLKLEQKDFLEMQNKIKNKVVLENPKKIEPVSMRDTEEKERIP